MYESSELEQFADQRAQIGARRAIAIQHCEAARASCRCVSDNLGQTSRAEIKTAQRALHSDGGDALLDRRDVAALELRCNKRPERDLLTVGGGPGLEVIDRVADQMLGARARARRSRDLHRETAQY